VTSLVERVVESDAVPEGLLRLAIRGNLRRRLARERRRDRAAFVEELRRSPIAVRVDKPNEQHYEVPPEFFELVLGPRLKYSCCFWGPATSSLAEAEEEMLRLTCERARIEDGMEILDLGCGWGSLAGYVAERFPAARVLAVSNSRPQREYVERRGLPNLEVVTADVSALELDRRFDRVVSVEMFEHMRNYEALFRRVARLLRPDGLLFIHVFCHRELAYPYEDGWLARRFFTGGTMPSADLLVELARDVELVERRLVSGRHYARTAEAWLERLRANEGAVLDVLGRAYGPGRARAELAAWRVFFLACAELWGFRRGDEWLVAHYLFRPRPAG
jgi:cyclopropane-fatty-acyl-phospholipid synthase